MICNKYDNRIVVAIISVKKTTLSKKTCLFKINCTVQVICRNVYFEQFPLFIDANHI